MSWADGTRERDVSRLPSAQARAQHVAKQPAANNPAATFRCIPRTPELVEVLTRFFIVRSSHDGDGSAMLANTPGTVDGELAVLSRRRHSFLYKHYAHGRI